MIDNSEDGVVSVRFREADYKIHSYLLERKGSWICGDLVHWWARTVGDDLVLLTRRTPLDVFCDPGAHVWPPVVPLGLGDGFVTSRVSSYKALVYYSHDLPFDCKVRVTI